jgi:ABC-type sugar transport system ATPase subunit
MDLERLLPLYPAAVGRRSAEVSLARQSCAPAVYLMDEPLRTGYRWAARDAQLIRAEQLASGVATIYVTHDQEEAMSLADRIVVMDEGRIRQVGSPADVYDRPADLFVASFVGSPGMNFIRGEVAGAGGRGLFVSDTGRVRFDVPLEGTAPVSSGQATLGIRSEHVHPDASGPIWGRVVTGLSAARATSRRGRLRPAVMRADGGAPYRSAPGFGSTSTFRKFRSSTARRRRGCDRGIFANETPRDRRAPGAA